MNERMRGQIGETQLGFNARKVKRAQVLDQLLQWSIGPLVRSKGPLPALRSLEPKTILVLFPALIGDAALFSGFLRGLRLRYPSAAVTVVGQRFVNDLLGSQSLYDSFYEFRCPWRVFDYSPGNLRKMAVLIRELRKHRWDLAIDVRGDMRNIAFLYATGARYRVAPDSTGGTYFLTHSVSVPHHAKHLSDPQGVVMSELGGVVESPCLTISEADRAWADTLVSELTHGARCVVAIHPSTSRKSKEWFPDSFARVIEGVEQHFGAACLLVLGPNDTALGEAIVAQCKVGVRKVSPPLSRLPALLQRTNALIGLDSASGHLASAVGTPVLTLFGPSNAEFTRPLGSRNRVLIKDGFSCRPCGLGVCPLGVERSCMAAITPEDVLDGLRQLLGNMPASDDMAGRC